MRAYLICRNFSVNDGMYPSGHTQGGAVQGIPVAIGTGRKPSRDDDTDTSFSSSSGGSWSGGSSPERMMRMDQMGRANEEAVGGRMGAVSSLPASARVLAYARREV